MIAPKDSPIHLFFYQRIALRASIRYRYHSLTATRATSKSFIAILAMYLRCIFLPNSRCFVCADIKGTALKVTRQKLEEIWSWWPLLKGELEKDNMGSDYIELKFKNKSEFFIVSMSSAGRGNRATGGVIEEAALIDGDNLTEIIIPMLNVNRRLPDGTVDPDESHQQQTYITTASSKTCFMYEKLIEMVIMAILRPNEYFVWGMDFRIPVYHGLLDKRFLDEQRLSSTFKTESFARENMSIWTGSASESWFDNNRLIKYRKILKCERNEQNIHRNSQAFYIISVDVARYQANTVILVIKVFPHDEYFQKSVVNIEVFHDMSFPEQAKQIKKIVKRYNPRELVIDGNGLGAGLIDLLVLPTFDDETGETLEPIFVFNDMAYLSEGRKSTSDEPDPKKNVLIYNLKAGASNISEFHANCYSQITSGRVSFLANERVVKEKLLATKKGQKMSLFERHNFLLPYEMTSRLMDELNNLKLKPSGVANQINVEQISRRIPKDRFSALEYGLWRVKYYEDKALRKKKRRSMAGDMVLFSSKKGV